MVLAGPHTIPLALWVLSEKTKHFGVKCFYICILYNNWKKIAKLIWSRLVILHPLLVTCCRYYRYHNLCCDSLHGLCINLCANKFMDAYQNMLYIAILKNLSRHIRWEDSLIFWSFCNCIFLILVLALFHFNAVSVRNQVEIKALVWEPTLTGI